MAKENLITTAGIDVAAREIDFVTRFESNWKFLMDILGIMRPIKKQPGTILKGKRAAVTLQDGNVAEGAEIPYSKVDYEEVPYEEMTVEKYSKAVSIEAIKDHGYDVAVNMSDEAFKNKLQRKVTDKFYKFLATGTLKSSHDSFQMALAMAKGSVEEKFMNMDLNYTGVVGFANILDVYEYIGAANITIQNQFGLQYIKDYMGYNTIFLLSTKELARGTVIATVVENINLYYVDPADSDFARAGLQYTTSVGETNLIGFHTQGNYNTAVSEAFAIMGMTLFAEYLDAIAVMTFGAAG